MENISNKSRVKTIKIGSKYFIEKHYDDLKRYSCELKYLRKFKEKGILVPNIYNHDKKKRIILIEKINGRIGNKLIDESIKSCIGTLCKIAHLFDIEKNNNKEIKKYILRVKSNILYWCKKNSYEADYKELDSVLEELRKNCYISIFKDAKPSNWIFQKNNVYAIDFDYVRKSFFLADLAQLLSYVSLNNKIDNWLYVKYFLRRTLPFIKNYDKFRIPFMLAIVNSNIASKIHRYNLSFSEEKGFERQNKLILKELKIICR